MSDLLTATLQTRSDRPGRISGPNAARALEMSARIFRASVGAFDLSVSDVIESDNFRAFCALKGDDVHPLTPFFDLEYYLESIPLHIGRTTNPVLHFCRFGPVHGRAPTRLLDTDFLRRQLGWPDFTVLEPSGKCLSLSFEQAQSETYSDVVELFVAVLENIEPPFLSPHPLFDPDLWRGGGNDNLGQHPIVSFLLAKNVAGRPFSPYFSLSLTTRLRPYATVSGRHNLLLRYIEDCVAGLSPDVNPMFHGLYYRSLSQTQSTDWLSHYLTTGSRLGLPPNPFADEELGITDADRISGSLQEIYLDYLRCDADLAGGASLTALLPPSTADARRIGTRSSF